MDAAVPDCNMIYKPKIWIADRRDIHRKVVIIAFSY